MNYLSVVAIVKDEAPYIEEWLEFHRLMGVEHFYIYDNGSTDGTLILLNKQPDVYIIPWHKFPGQRAAYADALATFATASEWMAFVDADEFLYSPQRRDLKEVLRTYDQYSGVAVHWVIYGSSGHKTYENKPVLDRFEKRSKEVNQHVKTIVHNIPGKPVYTGYNVHSFTCKRGKIVDENGKRLRGNYALQPGGTADILRINHYHVKSEEEYREKCKKKRADAGTARDFDTLFPAHDENDITDRSAALVRDYFKEHC